MIADILTMCWKEWREVILQAGGRGKVGFVVSMLILGIVLPLQMGTAWLNAPFMAAWVSYITVIVMVADSFAGERERRTLETLLASRLPDRAILYGKIAAIVGYAWLLCLATMLIGLIVVNVAHGHGRLLFYTPLAAGATVGLTLLVVTMAASVGVLISLRALTVRQAQQALSLILMIPLVLVPFALQMLPHAWLDFLARIYRHGGPARLAYTAAAALAVLDVVLLLAVRLRFRRSRLILE